jgi:hypothetical protein
MQVAMNVASFVSAVHSPIVNGRAQHDAASGPDNSVKFYERFERDPHVLERVV